VLIIPIDMMAEEQKANNFNTSDLLQRSYYNLGAGIDAGNTDIESEDGLSYDEMFSQTRVDREMSEVSESGSEDVEMVMSRYDPPLHQIQDTSPPDSLASEIKSAELESLESLEEEDVLASYNYINKDAIKEKDMLNSYSYINKDSIKPKTKQVREGVKQVDCDITEARHGRDSGTSSPSHTSGWALPSIPPDIVASANHVRVIRVAPRQTFRLDLTPADCDLADIHGTKDSKERRERQKESQTGFCPHHIQAYTNLEDFEDEAWEQSDFEPSDEAPVDVVVRAGGENGGAGYESQVQGRRRRQRVVHQIGAGGAVEYTCGPQCCVLM